MTKEGCSGRARTALSARSRTNLCCCGCKRHWERIGSSYAGCTLSNPPANEGFRGGALSPVLVGGQGILFAPPTACRPTPSHPLELGVKVRGKCTDCFRPS